MNDTPNKTFFLSHSSGGYDFRGNIDNLIPENSAQMWVKSYISMLTEYASVPGYASAPVTTKSFFNADENIVLIESYPRNDGRVFLESKVTIESKYDNIDFSEFLDTMTEFCGYDDFFVNKLHESLLLSLFSDDTVLYCVAERESDINLIRRIISEISSDILKLNSCIEIIGKIPPVKKSVAICRCILSNDKVNFLSEAQCDENYILIDFSDSTPTIHICLNEPSYAQLCLLKLFSKYNFENVYYSIEELIRLPLNKNNMRIYYNTLCLLMAYKNFRSDIFEISMTPREKEEIKSLLKEVHIP
ncbi:MAG: hypothetical protein IKB88_04960 [Clostridia bacterium]|nr:hypothetical protein [Clostridia bacterium]